MAVDLDLARDDDPGLARGGPVVPVLRTGLWALSEVRWAAAATGLFGAGVLAQLLDGPAWLWWTLYLSCYVAGGWGPGLSGLQALRERRLDVDLLMVVAAIGAAAIGQALDGGLLIVIFATSGALEAYGTQRTEDSVRGLLDLTPETATRLDPGSGETTVSADELEIGDTVLVRPGERLSADGTVIDGASEVDQATITGEPLPAAKAAGDEVFAGTINGVGALWVRVDRRADDTVIARIAALVQDAIETKARTQLFIEKIEQRYSVGMVAATIALFTVPLLFGADLQSTLLRAMTFMIVASPCAVVLSTMPPLLSAIANAGRHGVLIKSAVVMEQLGATTRVGFDKTGTLTEGMPRLTDVRSLPGAEADPVLALAAAAEHPSEHPLAGAVAAAARAAGVRLAPATDFESRPGRGVRARVEGRWVEVGSPTQLLAVEAPTAWDVVAELESSGQSAAVVLVDGEAIGVLGFSDRLRSSAPAAVRRLAELTSGSPLLLTGDNPRAAGRLARQVGISDVRSGLLPPDKVAAVRDLEADGERVLVVGDGVNDAPALAAAHVGVAMGGTGSDLALDSADAVVVRDDLATVPAAIALSRRARRLVLANLAIAGTFIAVLVAWDLFGHLPLPLGVAGHEGSTVIVGLNGLRLLRGAAWRRAVSEAAG